VHCEIIGVQHVEEDKLMDWIYGRFQLRFHSVPAHTKQKILYKEVVSL